MSGMPIGQRIGEILEERDISLASFSLWLRPVRSMSDTTLGRVIAGKRHLPPDELRDIAFTLKVSVDRITQHDTEKQANLLSTMKKANPRLAIEIGKELLPVALGWSEKVDVLNDLGTAHYFLKQYDEAQDMWSQAYDFALKVKDGGERLYKVANNLILVYTLRNDFFSLIRLYDSVDTKFHDRPELAGTFAYSYGIQAYNVGSYEFYRAKMYESLEHFTRSENERSIALATHTVAYAEFKIGNFSESKRLFESIIGHPTFDEEDNLLARKDYSKTLLKLGEENEALKVVESLLGISGVSSDSRAKVLLLHAHITNCPQSAETVLHMEGVSEELYVLARSFMMDYCARTGDNDGLANYYNWIGKRGSALSFDWEAI